MARGWTINCPKCGSNDLNTFRHMYAKMWCMDCGFVLRDEGSTTFNSYSKHVTPKEQEIPEVSMIYSSDFYVICPVCSERNGGWFGNPRGSTTECSTCGTTFKIHNDADVEIL